MLGDSAVRNMKHSLSRLITRVTFLKDTNAEVNGVGHWSSILVLVFFILSSELCTTLFTFALTCRLDLAIILPAAIPIPHRVTSNITKLLVRMRITSPSTRPYRRRHIYLNFITVPLSAVLILLACGAIDGTVLQRGIIGADGVKPINIMALFISLVRSIILEVC